MRTWADVEIPGLPGRPGRSLPGGDPQTPALRLFDTASQRLVDVSPVSGPARLYVCGITPYDATHMGHAATYVTFDLVVRMWRDAGHEVAYTQNVTDVDDPLLERARVTGEDWVALAERETQLFRDDMAALRVLPPGDFIGAVESIPWVVEMIGRLQAAGAVYALPSGGDPQTPDGDGDLYFAVKADPAFGAVSGYDVDLMRKLFAERGGDPDRVGKRDPLDCLLWQLERPGEPSWDSPFGPGRPGWHVECAAIALHHLGMTVDIQGGGSDLIFPHHEMSASEAQVATGSHPFARAYVHQAMVGLDGEKMSKSRGNLVLVSKTRSDGADPMAIRLALLAHHYRADWFWSPSDLVSASDRLARWRAGLDRASGPDGTAVLAAVRAALADDLDTVAALAAVDAWAASSGPDSSAPGLVRDTVDGLLGVRL